MTPNPNNPPSLNDILKSWLEAKGWKLAVDFSGPQYLHHSMVFNKSGDPNTAEGVVVITDIVICTKSYVPYTNPNFAAMLERQWQRMQDNSIDMPRWDKDDITLHPSDPEFFVKLEAWLNES